MVMISACKDKQPNPLLCMISLYKVRLGILSIISPLEAVCDFIFAYLGSLEQHVIYHSCDFDLMEKYHIYENITSLILGTRVQFHHGAYRVPICKSRCLSIRINLFK